MSPTLRVAAYGVCIEKGRVLLARQVPLGGGAGMWTFPGGGVEQGEDPVDTVLREIAEETGLDAVVERLLGVGLALAATRPVTGHVDPVPVGGLIQH